MGFFMGDKHPQHCGTSVVGFDHLGILFGAPSNLEGQSFVLPKKKSRGGSHAYWKASFRSRMSVVIHAIVISTNNTVSIIFLDVFETNKKGHLEGFCRSFLPPAGVSHPAW